MQADPPPVIHRSSHEVRFVFDFPAPAGSGQKDDGLWAFSSDGRTVGSCCKMRAYGQSKSANILFSVGLDRRGQEHGMRAFAAHPGAIRTDRIRYMTEEELNLALGIYQAPVVFKNIEQVAATATWCALSPQLNSKGGVYCENCDVAPIVRADSRLPTRRAPLGHRSGSGRSALGSEREAHVRLDLESRCSGQDCVSS